MSAVRRLSTAVRRRVLPVVLTDAQAELVDAVLLHEGIGGGSRALLLPKIADQLRASGRDREQAAWVLCVDLSGESQ